MQTKRVPNRKKVPAHLIKKSSDFITGDNLTYKEEEHVLSSKENEHSEKLKHFHVHLSPTLLGVTLDLLRKSLNLHPETLVYGGLSAKWGVTGPMAILGRYAGSPLTTNDQLSSSASSSSTWHYTIDWSVHVPWQTSCRYHHHHLREAWSGTKHWPITCLLNDVTDLCSYLSNNRVLIEYRCQISGTLNISIEYEHPMINSFLSGHGIEIRYYEIDHRVHVRHNAPRS